MVVNSGLTVIKGFHYIKYVWPSTKTDIHCAKYPCVRVCERVCGRVCLGMHINPSSAGMPHSTVETF